MIKDVFGLHAHSIRFEHPFTKEGVEISAEVPEHFYTWIE